MSINVEKMTEAANNAKAKRLALHAAHQAEKKAEAEISNASKSIREAKERLDAQSKEAMAVLHDAHKKARAALTAALEESQAADKALESVVHEDPKPIVTE